MSAVAEAMIAAFDSTTRLTWTTKGADTALASFSYMDFLVTVTFSYMSEEEWQVASHLSPELVSGDAVAFGSIRIFSGVFQAVREFLEVRQPVRLVFTSKQEALADIYETYLERQNTELNQLGYRMVEQRAEPFVEYALEKQTPSAWQN